MSGPLEIITILRFHRLASRIASHLTTERPRLAPISHAHVVYVLRDQDREREREREGAREEIYSINSVKRKSHSPSSLPLYRSLSTFGLATRTFPRIQQTASCSRTAFCQDSRFQAQRFICPRARSTLLAIFTCAYSRACLETDRSGSILNDFSANARTSR